jgi:hypothetical protein
VGHCAEGGTGARPPRPCPRRGTAAPSRLFARLAKILEGFRKQTRIRLSAVVGRTRQPVLDPAPATGQPSASTTRGEHSSTGVPFFLYVRPPSTGSRLGRTLEAARLLRTRRDPGTRKGQPGPLAWMRFSDCRGSAVGSARQCSSCHADRTSAGASLPLTRCRCRGPSPRRQRGPLSPSSCLPPLR